MPRPLNPDLSIAWKVHLPATLAGTVEMFLLDPIHSKPIYGARGELIRKLLEFWLATIEGREPQALPTLEEIRG